MVEFGVLLQSHTELDSFPCLPEHDQLPIPASGLEPRLTMRFHLQVASVVTFVAVFLGPWQTAAAFVVQPYTVHQQRNVARVVAAYSSSTSSSSSSPIDESSSNANNNQATLCLNGNSTKCTKTLPMSSPSQVLDFLKVPLHRDCVMTGGNVRTATPIGTTVDLLELWTEKAAAVGGTPPDQDDTIVEVQTGAINFPGLSVSAVSTMGVKFLERETEKNDDADGQDDYPIIEFTLIKDKTFVEGAPPIKWVYNKLTGSGGGNSPSSLSKLMVVTTPDGSGLCFQSEANLQVKISFPKILLKILPTTQEKAEQNGAVSITRALEKEQMPSLTKLEELYEAWVETTKE